MRASFSLNYTESQRYEELLKQLPNRSEAVINKYLEATGIEIARREMENLTPVSDRQKSHAKYAKPYSRQEFPNLGFTVITSKAYNYLVFPDEGLGTSKGKAAQQFASRGVERASKERIKGINDA